MKGWSRLSRFFAISAPSTHSPLLCTCSARSGSATGQVRQVARVQYVERTGPRSHVCYGFTYVITHFAMSHVMSFATSMPCRMCSCGDHVLCHVLCHVKAKAVSRLVAPLGHGRMIPRDRMFECVTSTALFAADLSRKWRRRVCTKKR